MIDDRGCCFDALFCSTLVLMHGSGKGDAKTSRGGLIGRELTVSGHATWTTLKDPSTWAGGEGSIRTKNRRESRGPEHSQPVQADSLLCDT